MKRWLKWLLRSLLGLSLLAGAAITVLSTTQWGLQWVTDRITGAVPGELHIQSVSGRLIGPIRLRGLAYRGAGAILEIASVSLDWRPLALLTGTLHVDRFDLAGVRYAQSAAPPATAGRVARPPDIPLPLAVKLDRMAVRDLTIRRHGGAPVHVDTIMFAAHTAHRAIRVSRLAVSARGYDLTVHGSVRPRGAYPMEWHAIYTVRAAGMHPFSGTLAVKGSLKALEVTQHLEAPVRIDIQGRVNNVMEKPAWRARVALHHVRPRDIRASFPAAEVEGLVHLHGDLNSAAATGDVSVKTRLKNEPLPVDARFELAYRNTALTIDRLNLRIPGGPARLTVTGRVEDLAGARRAALTVAWAHLAWPPAAKDDAAITSENGTLELDGTLSDYSLTGHAALGARQLPPATVRVKAQGDRGAATLTELRIQALEGAVTGRGSVAWKPRLAWRLQLRGDHLNPGTLRPDYPGHIDFTAAFSGGRGTQGLSATLDLQRLQGMLRGNPVKGDARIHAAGSRLEIHRLTFASGKTHLSASGRIGETWNLRWRIDSPDIHALYPKAHGALKGDGRLEGRLRRPTLKAALSGRQLDYGPYRIGSIQVSLDVDTSRGDSSTLAVKAFGLRIKEHHIAFVHLTGGGTLSDHHLEAAVHSDTGVLSMTLAGGYRGGRWTGALRRLDLVSRDAGYWHLKGAVPATAAEDGVRIERLCWQRKGAHLCGLGAWRRGGDWHAGLDLNGFQLQWLAPLVTPQAKLSGIVNAQLTAQRKASQLSGHANVTLSRASVATTLPDGNPIAMTITQAVLRAETQGRAVHATLKLSTDQGGSLDGELTVPLAALPTGEPAGGAAPAIKGHLSARLTDLKMLPRLVPTVENTRGKMTATLDIAGTLRHPKLAGTVELKDGTMDVPSIGIHVTDVALTAKSPDGRTFSLDGTAHSGGGSMHIAANGRLPFAGGEQVTVRVTSRAFEMVRIPEAQALATSDITLKLSATRLDFSGTVTIPRAKLQPRDISGAVRPSSDVTLVNGPVETAAPGRQISGTIQINLGRNVSVKGFGLEGQVTGSITVKEQPKQTTLGYGSLNITGKYRAYGQNLDIQQGRLSFVGSPIDNPGLNIKAVRTTGDVTAGINVTGTLQDPNLTIFSQPPMDDANALSYLLLGRPIKQASTKQGDTLVNAAASLGLSGGEFLAKKIGHMFGIEDVRIESTNGNQTASLVLGKYLTPDLYISYGFGLLEPLNTLQLRYRISKHWELKAQSGQYNGGDILYTINTK